MAKISPPKPERIDPLKYLEFLLSKMAMDRYFYLIATGVSVLLIVYAIVMLLKSGQITAALAVCAPAGALGVCCNKILKFWNDCLKIINTYLDGANR